MISAKVNVGMILHHLKKTIQLIDIYSLILKFNVSVFILTRIEDCILVIDILCQMQ